MDSACFDDLARDFAVPTRRGVLAAAATAVLAALVGRGASDETLARRKQPKAKHKKQKQKPHQKHESDRVHASAKKKKKKTKKKDRPGRPGPCTGVVCGTVPHGTTTCSAGVCVIKTCDAGFRDCDGIVANGCETDIQNDARNCGRCGQVCPGSGADRCSAGECTLAWRNQTTFGTYGTGASQFVSPAGLFVSHDGTTAFVADYGWHRISVWTRSSASSTDWANQTTFGTEGSGPSQFNSAQGVAVSQDGRTAFVADTSNHRVSVWTRSDAGSTDWTNQTTFGMYGSGAREFYGLWSIFVTKDGLTAFVAEVQNSRISVWTRSSASSTDWSNQTSFGTKGSGPGQLEWPTDIFVADDGLTAFVADHDNHRISVWTRSDAGSTDWANQLTFGSHGDGASEFYWPSGVFASGDCRTVFVGDTENGRVSVWTLS